MSARNIGIVYRRNSPKPSATVATLITMFVPLSSFFASQRGLRRSIAVLIGKAKEESLRLWSSAAMNSL